LVFAIGVKLTARKVGCKLNNSHGVMLMFGGHRKTWRNGQISVHQYFCGCLFFPVQYPTKCNGKGDIRLAKIGINSNAVTCFCRNQPTALFLFYEADIHI
jgi:hypothetical protein